MKRTIVKAATLFLLIMLCNFFEAYSQSKGLAAIKENELRYNLNFLGAREFRGRETPSPELEIATLYLGNWAGFTGLKPLLKNNSFYQEVPVTVTSVFQPNTKIRVTKDNDDRIYYFGRDFNGSFQASGSYWGNVVFVGLGISDPEAGWDDLKGLDLKGKVVIILDEQRPGSKYVLGSTWGSRLTTRIAVLREKGASAVLSVVDMERNKRMEQGLKIFDYIPTGRMAILYDSQVMGAAARQSQQGNNVSRPSLPFERAEISHDLAAEILGVPKSEIGEWYKRISRGEQVPPKKVNDVTVRLDVEVESFKTVSRNVVAVVEGSDPVLKNEYVLLCGHHDARGIDDGEIIAGADDNGTATVALMAIGKALLAERPKRSVILAWFIGEEQGLNGSHYFANNCPVPIEKISSCLNMDMIGRNSSDSLFLVGSDLLSSGLDGAIKAANKKAGINFAFDYTYSNLTHPQRVYFRSDHYPFVRFGIPSVWIFSGFTPDYHTERDIPEAVNYTKFLKTTRLVYQSAFDIGNMKELLKLDVNPAVKSRGKHNLNESSLYGR
jgi:hypothetical protein